jgi:septal ring factor EnvC (AmiA/AmiB activator)
MMRLTIAFSLALAVLAGCVRVHTEPTRSYSPAAPVATTPATACTPQEMQALRDENAKLRAELQKIEEYNNQWDKVVDGRKSQLKQLEHRREELKDRRNQLRKALEGD